MARDGRLPERLAGCLHASRLQFISFRAKPSSHSLHASACGVALEPASLPSKKGGKNPRITFQKSDVEDGLRWTLAPASGLGGGECFELEGVFVCAARRKRLGVCELGKSY